MPHTSFRPIVRVITQSFLLLSALFIHLSVHAADSLSPQLLKKLNQVAKLQDGEVLYIDFWASWCNPCRKSFPWMNEMHKKYSSRGLKIVAVNVDTEAELAAKFLQQVPASFAVHYDPAGELATDFQIPGMPSSFIIDSAGRVHFSHTGFFLNQTHEYENEIVSLLKK